MCIEIGHGNRTTRVGRCTMRHLELAALDVYDGGRVVYVVGALASELEWQLGRANHVMRDGRGWWRMGVKNERERIRAKSEEGKSQRVHVNQHNNPASRISGPHARHIAPHVTLRSVLLVVIQSSSRAAQAADVWRQPEIYRKLLQMTSPAIRLGAEAMFSSQRRAEH